LFEFLVELEAIIAGNRTEDTTAAGKQRRLDRTAAGTARTLLTLQLAGRTCDFVALLRLVGTLTLVGQILLHVEVNSVVISLHAEDGVRKDYLTTRLFLQCSIQLIP